MIVESRRRAPTPLRCAPAAVAAAHPTPSSAAPAAPPKANLVMRIVWQHSRGTLCLQATADVRMQPCNPFGLLIAAAQCQAAVQPRRSLDVCNHLTPCSRLLYSHLLRGGAAQPGVCRRKAGCGAGLRLCCTCGSKSAWYGVKASSLVLQQSWQVRRA